MTLYAKSAAKQVTEEERIRVVGKVESFMKEYSEMFEEWEKKEICKSLENFGKQDEKHQTTLTEHLDDIVKCAEKFFAVYGNYFTNKEKQMIRLSCGKHDIGKANYVFQGIVDPDSRIRNHVERNVKQIPHGFLSGLLIDRESLCTAIPDFSAEDFSVFLTAVYFHHSREDTYSAEALKEYFSKYCEPCLKEFLKENIKFRTVNRNRLLFSNSQAEYRKVAPKTWNEYLLVKGMLNKFDWTVSAGYEKAENGSDLQEKLLVQEITNTFHMNLRPLQLYMRDRQAKNLVIIAPTGAGKTEAALLWINGEKAFYTLPLKVSSNAIYDRIRKSYVYEKVTLLHSDSMQNILKESVEESADNDRQRGYENYEKAKLLSFPLTICTVDQLFKFVYKALGTEIFAATLKYSKIVIDEIQAYSPRIIATIIAGLYMIKEMGGHFAIITATFPPVLRYFMEQKGLLENESYELKNFTGADESKRHIFSLRETELDYDLIAKKGKRHKVLVICNTVNKAQSVYEELENRDAGVKLLHARFIRRDRQLLEEKIQKFSEDRAATGIWVTTQIVEASLDIDFEYLFTEMCTCDSLLQRMGRCNRKGRYDLVEANVYIYANENGVGKKKVYDPVIYRRSVDALKQYEGQIFKESMKDDYMNQVYAVDAIKETDYYKEIELYLEHFEIINPLEYTKKEADQAFRSINSITVIPDRIYHENEPFIHACTGLEGKVRIGKEISAIVRAKLDELTLSLNLYNRYPTGVDREVIHPTEIHRANMKYDFDAESCTGKGLILNVPEDEYLMV